MSSASTSASGKLKKQSQHELRVAAASPYRDDPDHDAEAAGAAPAATMSSSSPSNRLLPRTDVSPKTVSALIRRVRALVVQLIPAEIEADSITGPEGILTADVVKAFDLAGGDFADAVPFALIEAYHDFRADAQRSDYSLNTLRATACETLARRLVAHFESSAESDYFARHPNVRGRYEGSHVSLSKRFRRALPNGTIVKPRSALESAVEGGCQVFLTSPEAQRTIEAIWRGTIVQDYADDGTNDVFLVRYPRRYSTKFRRHFHPSRLSVPLYQYILSVSLWMVFVAIYSVATWSFRPTAFSLAELVMYGMAIGYLTDDVQRWIKIRGLGQISVWTVLDIFTDCFLTASFFLRMWALAAPSYEDEVERHKLSFRVLVSAAPFIWIQLLRVGDCVKFFGTIQVIILKMLSESAAFFLLLVLSGMGAAQALWGLNLVDDRPIPDAGSRLVELVLQGVLGAMSFGTISSGFSGAFGKIIAYIYYFILILILRSILVALFGTAFASVQKDATNIYLTFFASRVVDSIGVPDRHVFVAPFNLIEILVAAPIGLVVPRKTYHRIVNTIQYFVFFVPLAAIAFYESRVDRRAARAQQRSSNGPNEPIAGDDREHAIQLGERGTVEDPAMPDDAKSSSGPDASSAAAELQISRVPFKELVKGFPAATQTEGKQHEVLLARVADAGKMVEEVLREVRALRAEVGALKAKEAAVSAGKKE